MTLYEDELPEYAVLIGDDQYKSFLLLICEGEDKGVYYWDDKRSFEASTDEANAYLISGDFRELDRLLG